MNYPKELEDGWFYQGGKYWHKDNPDKLMSHDEFWKQVQNEEG